MAVTITYQNVSRRFGEVTALSASDLDVPAGQFVALVGPSGCGKTTLLRLTADLDQPSTGRVLIGGKSPAAARQQRLLGLVSQRPAVLPWKRALDDVRFTQACTQRPGLPAAELLQAFGLAEHQHKLPHHLSGGMLQRVNFASAIAHDPEVLLMDEPFSALDEMKREELGLWLGQVLVERPKTVLFVTHHVDEAVLLADRVLVFSSSPGRIVADLAVTMPRPRTAAFRSHPEFLALTSDIRGLLFGKAVAA
jgi:NitT/TauT family transport system ATP-binding protein